jgi:hypothetical protein
VSKQAASLLSGAIGQHLYTERFFALASVLQQWRIDPIMQQMDADRDEGRILGFVKGLRLSAQLAYAVREILSGENVEVSWGHLVDESGQLCSPECDIIIHRPGHMRRWNGDGGNEPIMDFRFIESTKALGLISCKSLAKSIDKDYCKSFEKYQVENILLFVECCPQRQLEQLRKQANEAGYRGLFYLFTLEDDNFTVKQDPAIYAAFVQALKDLVCQASPQTQSKRAQPKRGRRKKV